MNPLLSVIIPIYNVERYLDDCLRHIVGKFEDLVEIILIDDGSKDSSGLIADSFADKYCNVYVSHKKNGGLSDARNYGLRRSSGKYVFFYDSDDMVREDFLKIVLRSLQDTQLDILLWDADIINETGEKLNNGVTYYHHLGAKEFDICSGKDIIEGQLRRRNDYVTTVWLGLYGREFLLSNNFWFEKGLLHEDEIWTQKVLIEALNVKYIPDALYYYRLRENSIMREKKSDFGKNIDCLIYAYSNMLIYYDWKVRDVEFRKDLKGNTVKRYLHMVAKYDVAKYPECSTKVNRIMLLKNASNYVDRLRALLLVISIRGYCFVARHAIKEKSHEAKTTD